MKPNWKQLQYAAPIILGSFLLFQIQPIMAKFILPWFGGTSAVWITAVLFFQVLLLVGYAYAAVITRWLLPKHQAVVHMVLLLLACVTLPITPEKPLLFTDNENPVWQVLSILGSAVALQYALIASTSPLLQAWLSKESHHAPYRWYALSNIASLIGLLAVPFLVEPFLSSDLQTQLWSGLFIFYACLSLPVILRLFSNTKQSNASEANIREARLGPWNILLWIILSATGVVLLLSTTTLLTQDIAPAPLLWILPLVLYLLTYILAFDSPHWYKRQTFAYIFLITAILLAIVLKIGNDIPILSLVGICALTVFVGCMIVHGELVRRKPGARYLTEFYLYLALGGALGGVFAGLIAPQIFRDLFELHISIGIITILISFILFQNQNRGNFWRQGMFFPALGIVIIGISLGLDLYDRVHSPLYVHRNFYGISRVLETRDSQGLAAYRTLISGGTEHGKQVLNAAELHMPTLYYTPESGVGRALQSYPEREQLRVGLLGLGLGTLAAYGDNNDYYKFYEINPDMAVIAKNYFSYIEHSSAQIDIAFGDARLLLEHEQPQQFHVLVLDVFSSDAIPIHLLTTEAFDVYLKHLIDNGVLAVHISNRHLNLQPVLGALAEAKKLHAIRVYNDNPSNWGSNSDWILLSRQSEVLTPLQTESAHLVPLPKGKVWTDSYSNLLSVIRWPTVHIHDRLRFW